MTPHTHDCKDTGKMICYRAALILCLIALLALLHTEKAAASVSCHGCTCNNISNTGQLNVDCNGESIQSVMDSFRESGKVGTVRQLTFIGAPEAALETDVFEGLTELRSLTIQFCLSLAEIRPRAFNSLNNLESLFLEENALEWLSGSSFEGIGSSLVDLSLDHNRLRNLRSDLEPFFSTISDTISLRQNTEFICDCHLQWLVQFIAAHPTQPEVDVDGAVCQDPPNTPLLDPSVDFTSAQCEDICALGYHSCVKNATVATCTVMGNSTTCSCNDGYIGDGTNCSAIPVDFENFCESYMCSDDAVCVAVPSLSCTCKPGYTGNGRSCVLLDQCEAMCNGTDLHCIVNVDTGRIDCGSEDVQQLQQTLLSLSADPSIDPGLIMFSSELVEVARNVSLPGDVPAIVDLLVMAVDVFRERNQLDDNSTFINLVEVGSELLHFRNQPLWGEIEMTSVSDHITDLFVTIESLGEALFVSSQGYSEIASDNIALIVTTPDCEEADHITISSSVLEAAVSGGGSSVQLPPTVFGDENCTEVGIIAVVYNGVGPLLNLDNELIPNCTSTPAPLVYGQCQWSRTRSFCPEDLQVNSVIISAEAVRRNETAVDQLNTTSLPDPIIITLRHENITLTNPTCSFLRDEQTDESWMSDGCSLVPASSNANATVCECYHLTSFALLMSPTGPTNATLALQIVSKVGLSISVLCLLVTIVLLFGLKLDTKLHHVHRQLALALCLAQLLFLVAVDRTLVPSPDALCTVIAALLHYLFLCTFAWQLVEGVHLYLFVVKVFFNKKIVWLYYPLAWGVPLVVVGITMGIRFCDYGSENFCWISNENGANWAFHGPVIAVLAINIIIMVVVTAIIIRSQKKTEDKFLICTLLHASFVLVPILGITWVLGFFIVGDTTFSMVVEWLFCIFTASQGVMIFIMHVLLNRDVRKAFLKKMGCHEAAHKQQRLTLRRSSTVQSASQISGVFKRTFNFTGGRRKSTGDITLCNLDHSHSFTVARPHSAKARNGVSATNPLMKIDEEGDSLPNSLGGTPLLPKANESVVIDDEVLQCAKSEGEDSSGTTQHSRTGNGAVMES